MNESTSREPDVIDEASKLRMEKFRRLKIKNVPETLSLPEYENLIKRRLFVNKAVLEQVEQVARIMICHACLTTDPNTGYLQGTPFFVQTEKDELGVFAGLAHLTCHYCGFEEYYPEAASERYTPHIANQIPPAIQGMQGMLQGLNSIETQNLIAAYNSQLSEQAKIYQKELYEKMMNQLAGPTPSFLSAPHSQIVDRDLPLIQKIKNKWWP